MTTRPTQPKSTVISLPPPPVAARYGDLLEKLLDVGVRPPSSGKAGKAWSKKEFSYAVGFNDKEAKQIRRYCDGDGLPPVDRSKKVEEALFGANPNHYVAWRAALQDALEREDPQRKNPQTNEAATGVEEGAVTIQFPLHSAARLRVPLNFHGRDDDLTTIASLLAIAPHRVAIYGPHGVGKTVLGAAVGDRSQLTYQTVGWIDASTRDTCIAGLLALGRRLGLVNDRAADGEAVTQTLAHLSRQGENCLLIYDDASNATELHPLLPNGNVRVLITSNSPNWRSEATPVELKSWSIEFGAQYFMRRMVNVDPEDASALSQQLDGLPLLLELAATFCERRGMTLKDYRRRLIEAPFRDLLSREIRTPGYSRFIDAAFELSIGAATAEHQAAAIVIETLSSFPYTTVPLFVFSRGWAAMQNVLGTNFDDDALDAAVAALRNHSLISVTPWRGHWRSPHCDVISIHRLVRMIAQRRVTDLNLQHRAVASILSANLPSRLNPVMQDKDVAIWLHPQINPFLAKSTVALSRSDEFSLLEVRWVISRLLDSPKQTNAWRWRRNIVLTSKHPNALAELKSLPLSLTWKAVRKQRKLAECNELTIASMLQVLGICLLQHEKYRSAEIVLKQSLRIRETQLALYHPDIAEAMSALAYYAECRGSHADAQIVRKKILQSRRKFWPKETLELANIFVDLAKCDIRAGNIAAAIPALAHAILIEAALTDRLELPMSVTNPALVNTFEYLPDCPEHLDNLLATVHFLAKVRGDSDATRAKAKMEIGFATREVGLYNLGREIVLKDLVFIPDPHVVRMDAYWRLGRKYPSDKGHTEELDFVIEMLRRALAQAERLKSPNDLRVATIFLAMTLEVVPGCEDEALRLRSRYPPSPAD